MGVQKLIAGVFIRLLTTGAGMLASKCSGHHTISSDCYTSWLAVYTRAEIEREGGEGEI